MSGAHGRLAEDVCDTWTAQGPQTCNWQFYDPVLSQWFYNYGQGNSTAVYCAWCSLYNNCRVVANCSIVQQSMCRAWDLVNDVLNIDESYCNTYLFNRSSRTWLSYGSVTSLSTTYTRCAYCPLQKWCVELPNTTATTAMCNGIQQSSLCSQWAVYGNCNLYQYCPKLGQWIATYYCPSTCGAPCTACAWCSLTNICIVAANAKSICPGLAAEPCSTWNDSPATSGFSECFDNVYCSASMSWYTWLGACQAMCPVPSTCLQCGRCNSTKSCVTASILNASTCPGWTSNCSAFDSPSVFSFRCSSYSGFCSGAVSASTSCTGCYRCGNRCVPLALASTPACSVAVPCASLRDSYTCNIDTVGPDGTTYYLNGCPAGVNCTQCGWCNSTSTCMALSNMSSSTCPGWSSVCSIFDSLDSSYCQSSTFAFCPGVIGLVYSSSMSSYSNCTQCGQCPSNMKCLILTSLSSLTCTNWTSFCSAWTDPNNCNHQHLCGDKTWSYSTGYVYCNSATPSFKSCRWCPTLGRCLPNTTMSTACTAFSADPCGSIDRSECNSMYFCRDTGDYASYSITPSCIRCGYCSSTTRCSASINTTCPSFSSWCSMFDGDQQNCNSQAICNGSLIYGGYNCIAPSGICASGCNLCVFCNATQKCSMMTSLTQIGSSCSAILNAGLCSAWDSNSDSCNLQGYCPGAGWMDSSSCLYSCPVACTYCGYCIATMRCLLNTSINSSSCPGYVDRCSSLSQADCSASWANFRYRSISFCGASGALVQTTMEMAMGRTGTSDERAFQTQSTYSPSCYCPSTCQPCSFCAEAQVCLSAVSWRNGRCAAGDPCKSFFSNDAFSCSRYSLGPTGDWSDTCLIDFRDPKKCLSCHFCASAPAGYRGSCRRQGVSCFTQSLSATANDRSSSVTSTDVWSSTNSQLSVTSSDSRSFSFLSVSSMTQRWSSISASFSHPSESLLKTHSRVTLTRSGTRGPSESIRIMPSISTTVSVTALVVPTSTGDSSPSRKLSSSITLHIVVESPVLFLQAAIQATASTIAAAATSASFAGGAAATDAQSLAIIGSISCSSSSTKSGGSDSPLMYFLSPFFSSGVAAITLGNMGLGVAVLVVQSSVMKFGKLQAQTVRFPAVTYFAVSFLHPGTCYGAFRSLFSLEEPHGALEIFSGVIGIIYVLSTLVAVPSLVHRFVDKEAVFKPYELKHVGAILLPFGTWGPQAVTRQFGKLFASCDGSKRRNKYIVSFPMYLTTVVALLAAVGFPEYLCALQLGLIAVCYFLAAVLVLVTRPMRSNVANVLGGASMTLLGLLSTSAALKSPDSAATMTFLQLVVVFTRAIYDTVVFVLEQIIWPRQQGYSLTAAEIFFAPLAGNSAPDHDAPPDEMQIIAESRLADERPLTPPLPMAADRDEFGVLLAVKRDDDDLFFATLSSPPEQNHPEDVRSDTFGKEFYSTVEGYSKFLMGDVDADNGTITSNVPLQAIECEKAHADRCGVPAEDEDIL